MVVDASSAGQARSTSQSQARGRGQPGRVRGRWPEHTGHTEAAGTCDNAAYVFRTHKSRIGGSTQLVSAFLHTPPDSHGRRVLTAGS
jgi:hypothetical protein